MTVHASPAIEVDLLCLTERNMKVYYYDGHKWKKSCATYDCYSVSGKGGKNTKCGKTLMTTTRPLPLPPRRPSLSPPARRLSRLGLLCAAPGPHYPRLVISTIAIMTVCPTLRVPNRPSSPFSHDCRLRSLPPVTTRQSALFRVALPPPLPCLG